MGEHIYVNTQVDLYAGDFYDCGLENRTGERKKAAKVSLTPCFDVLVIKRAVYNNVNNDKTQ